VELGSGSNVTRSLISYGVTPVAPRESRSPATGCRRAQTELDPLTREAAESLWNQWHGGPFPVGRFCAGVGREGVRTPRRYCVSL